MTIFLCACDRPSPGGPLARIARGAAAATKAPAAAPFLPWSRTMVAPAGLVVRQYYQLKTRMGSAARSRRGERDIDQGPRTAHGVVACRSRRGRTAGRRGVAGSGVPTPASASRRCEAAATGSVAPQRRHRAGAASVAQLRRRSASATERCRPHGAGTTSATPASDFTAVKQADFRCTQRQDHSGNRDPAQITDPVARKLVEWVILRSDNNGSELRPLCRLHHRQSELAQHRNAAPAGRVDDVDRAAGCARRARVLRQEPAADRQGPFRTRPRSPGQWRPRPGTGAGARRLAQRQLRRRSGNPGARALRQPDHRRRS